MKVIASSARYAGTIWVDPAIPAPVLGACSCVAAALDPVQKKSEGAASEAHCDASPPGPAPIVERVARRVRASAFLQPSSVHSLARIMLRTMG
jgi:hypothetical protein